MKMFKYKSLSILASFVLLYVLVFSPIALLPVRAQEADGGTPPSTEAPAPTPAPAETTAPTDTQTPPAATDGTDGTVPDQATQSNSSAGDGGSGGEANGPAEITTGDALAESDTSTTANINSVDTLGSGTSTPATTTPQHASGSGSTTTTIADSNTATSTTAGTTTAQTGDNQASASVGGSGGSASIDTGNAYASANVINAVNVNIVNSDAFFFLLSNFLRSLGDLDFRSLFSSFQMPSVSGCNTGCDATSGKLTTTVTNTNDAVVSNSTIVRADTGGNTATGTDAYIGTGDAYASANVLNLVNANFVDSQYLLVAFNNFGNWAGDFVLPSTDFFSSFFSGSGVSGNTTVTNTNNATVNNNVSTNASTGGNTATGGDSLIVTGDAGSQSTVYNQVNNNLFGGATLLVVFRIYGNWNGSVFNAPPGVLWSETPGGVELVYDPQAAASAGSASGGTGGTNHSSLSINNTNNATVNNDVQVYALTGDNKLHGSESGTIETGNAFASSNVMNIVNTNTYSHNYILAFVNIFGDWSGSLSFGRPDLWIGMRAETPSVLYAGTTLRYHFVVKNRGDANASHVRIKHVFDNPLVNFLNDHGLPTDPEWDIGDIPAGGSKEIVVEAKVSNDIPPNDTLVTGTATVSSTETDDDTGDNSDTITLSIERNINSKDTNGTRVNLTQDANLRLTKSNDATEPMAASSTVNYTIKINNTGGPAYHASLVDELRNEQGKLVSRNTWDLDTIKPNEEITVDYAVQFSPKAIGGLYTNTAKVTAISGSPSVDPFYGRFSYSNVATSTVIIKPSPAVVGLTAPATDATGGGSSGANDTGAIAEAASVKFSKITEAITKTKNGLIPPLKFFGPHLPDNMPLVFAPENKVNEQQLAAALPAPSSKDVLIVSLLLLALLSVNAHRLGYLKQLPARVSSLQLPSPSAELFTRAYWMLWLAGFSRKMCEWWQKKKVVSLEWLRKQRDSWAESFASF